MRKLKDAPLLRNAFSKKVKSFSFAAAGTFACSSAGIVVSAMFSGRFATVWAPRSVEICSAKSLEFMTSIGLDSETYSLNSLSLPRGTRMWATKSSKFLCSMYFF